MDVTYFLINEWKLKPYSGNYTLNIVGNIFDLDGGVIFIPADIIEETPNNINLNTNTSVIVRRVEGASGGLDPDDKNTLNNIEDLLINSKTLEPDERTALFNIEGRVVAIESLFQSPIPAVLVDDDKDKLDDSHKKLLDLWRVHGLDIENPMQVSKTSRVAGDVTQNIEQIGEIVKVSRT